MKGLIHDNELSAGAKEMTGRIPSQYTVPANIGKKRKANIHKFTVSDTKTGKKYWIPAVAENKTTFKDFIINEASESAMVDKITALPDSIISELKKLISKGAKDLGQAWKNAAELVNTAYHVANIRRPVPDHRGAWKQYEELLKYGVEQLCTTRGNRGEWRSADVLFAESMEPLHEQVGGKRFFVKIPGEMDVEIDAKNMAEVIRELSNKIRHQGGFLEVKYRTQEGAVLSVWKRGEELEEIVVQEVS